MGAVDDVVRALNIRDGDNAERGLKVLPVVIASVNPLMVYVQGGSIAQPAEFLDGQTGSVGDSGYALYWPGVVGPIVFITDENDTGWIYVGEPGGVPFATGVAYGGQHQVPRFRRINGIVYMEGLVNGVPASPGKIFTLPVGFRPDESIHVPGIGSGSNEGHAIKVMKNGDVLVGTGIAAGAWASLVCQFPAAGAVQWHVVGAPGEPAFGSGWRNWSGAASPDGTPWGPAKFCKIGNYTYLSGLVERFSGSGVTIFTLPPGYAPTSGTTHTPCAVSAPMAGSDFGLNIFGASSSGQGQVNTRATGSNTGWVSLAGIRFWSGPANDPGWRRFNGGSAGWYVQDAAAYGSGWPIPQIRKDGKIIHLEGLANNSSATNYIKLPLGYGASGELILPVVASTNQRMDILSQGIIATSPSMTEGIRGFAAGIAGYTNSWIAAGE